MGENANKQYKQIRKTMLDMNEKSIEEIDIIKKNPGTEISLNAIENTYESSTID